MDASSSARAPEALPSLAALQSWVHRPQALAPCFVSDVYALRALREETADILHTTRDVFLLNHFPCKFVQLVGWVAGVDHKDTTMTITLDDGDGMCVLNVMVRLSEVEIKVAKATGKREMRTTFRSARERQRLPRPPPPSPTPPRKTYVRPDILVGDTVRLSGYVEEWTRRSEPLRQVVVDEASGSGYIRVVDPEEHYAHVENVTQLHREVYSRPFDIPAPPPSVSVPSSPPKSITSTWDMSSDLDIVEDNQGADLPHPSKLSSKLLNENTFKYYLMDHLVRETRRAMSSAARILLADPSAQVPELAALFPEYAECTVARWPEQAAAALRAPASPTPTPRARRSPTPKPRRTATPDVFAPSQAENSPPCTPRPRSTFRSKAERAAAKAQAAARGAAVKPAPAPTREPRSTFRSKAERERDAARARAMSDLDADTTPRPSRLALQPSQSSGPLALTQSFLPLEPFTVPSLLAVERLGVLAALVVDTRARREERARRQRVKAGCATREDEHVVADRHARSLRSSDYKLSPAERQRKMCRLVSWAIRAAAAHGELVQVGLRTHDSDSRSRALGSFDSGLSLPAGGEGQADEEGYLPVPPELLGPLLVPLASARATFRSRAEREAGGAGAVGAVSAHALLGRLRGWGTAGRWERIAMQPLIEAAEWAEAAGLLRLA